MTAIAGESGSGKTTLARLILGFIAPSKGQVLYRGKDLATMSRAERQQFRREVQPIFQDPFDVFNPFHRVDRVLSVPVRRYGLANSDTAARALVEDALRRVGLRPQDTLGRFPHELSGGQRQRIMVARAVLLRPRLIMADEPVSMVDASLRATILDELRTLNRELGIAVTYITHDLTTAYQICDNIVIFYRGVAVEAGTVERVIRSPRHPYTQLLVSSIPSTDRNKSWSTDDVSNPETAAGRISQGCCFAPRSPHAMEPCWTATPPKHLPEPDNLAAASSTATARSPPGKTSPPPSANPSWRPPCPPHSRHAAPSGPPASLCPRSAWAPPISGACTAGSTGPPRARPCRPPGMAASASTTAPPGTAAASANTASAASYSTSRALISASPPRSAVSCTARPTEPISIATHGAVASISKWNSTTPMTAS
jgi:peptide/nickel transport system ATP-binding protein